MKTFYLKKGFVTGFLVIILGALILLQANLSGQSGKTTVQQSDNPATSPQVHIKSGNAGKQSTSEPKKQGMITQSEYFTEYRLERDRNRSQQIDWLREIVNNQNSSAEARNEAQRRILNITQVVENEMKIESIIQARNIKECVAIIQEKSVTVIVMAQQLSTSDRSKIVNAAQTVTGLAEESINIITRN